MVRNGLDGQVIDFYLGSREQPHSYRVTGIVFEPGILTPDAQGRDQFSEHRVVSYVQANFNDAGRTPLTKDTENVHGEVRIDVPNLLASRITLIISHTCRPPKTPPSGPGAAPSVQGGVLAATLGGFAPPPDAPGPDASNNPCGQNNDPVDATFAISNLKIIGHEPL